MTIAAAYLTPEGVVFGTDSATTYTVPVGQQSQGNALKPYNHAQKLFEIGKQDNSRVALCTWGNALLGTISHRTIVARLTDWVINEENSTPPSIAIVVDKLIELVLPAIQGQAGEVGYFIGGWEPVTHLPTCHYVLFTNGQLTENKKLGMGQAQFSGDPTYFSRVYFGYDPRLLAAMLMNLKAQIGSLVPNLDQIFENARLAGLQVIPNGMFNLLPLREAIDFIHMHLHLTIKSSKFAIGPTICGGPIEIGFVSVDRPFRWVRHKNFESAILETELGEKGESL